MKDSAENDLHNSRGVGEADFTSHMVACILIHWLCSWKFKTKVLNWGIVEGQNPEHHKLGVCCVCTYVAWKGLGSVCG